MNISLDSDIAKKIEQGMKSGEASELPFPVVYIWTINGQATYKQQGGALYYGGWASKAEDMNAAAEQLGLSIPQDWKQVTINSRDGGEFEAYTCRSAIIAPIGKRISWLADGKRSTSYIEGGRRHVQVLAYLAENRSENGNRNFVPWGPVVLTAKGYQAGNLLEAFSQWDKATTQIRWKVAPGVPAWCFYLSLGTFGKERQVTNVGKPGAQSPITPITAYIPERLTEELMTSLFVGKEIAEKMASLQEQAAEWMNAWKAAPVSSVDEYGEADSSFFSSEEEIPF
ncbi:MAG: hypothetical protein EHM41_03935 [Chloroflexi bacterium]|nr:MAG: hypothetical protein EHM41_03935 [Chloroflexota bacterium]